MRFIQCILTVLLIITPIIGDYIVFKSKYSTSQLFRAVTDSLTHASIGLLSSVLFLSYNLNISNDTYNNNVILCTLLSIVIDVDHVFVSRSYKFRDMMSLKRGIFHSTTFWILVTLAIFIYAYVVKKINIYVLGFTVIIAYMSHHLRDANRRGLWFYPFGSTPPLSKFLYIAYIVLLPHIFVYVFNNFKHYFVKNVTQTIVV